MRPAGHTLIEPPNTLRYSRPVLFLGLEYSRASHGLSDLELRRPLPQDDGYCADGNAAGGRSCVGVTGREHGQSSGDCVDLRRFRRHG